MTSSPPEAEATPEKEVAPAEPDPLQAYADEVAAAVGGTGLVTFGTVKVTVEPDAWVAALTVARDELGLVLFSFLSAIDWSVEVAVGDPLDEPPDEGFEVLCTVGDVSDGRNVTFSTRLGHEAPVLATLKGVYAGADWHERETHEMFGIDFTGHGGLDPLYLPDGFIGHPLRKTFPLLSREVKPWPGKVDVEGMPGEDEEAEAGEGTARGGDDEGQEPA